MRMVALLVCDQGQVLPNGKQVLVGPFDRVSGALPVRVQCSVYVKVECSGGEHGFALVVRKQGVEDPGLRVEFGMRAPAVEGITSVGGFVGPLTLTLHREGRYMVDVEHEGKVLGETYLDVTGEAVLLLPGKGGVLVPTVLQGLVG